MNYAEIIEVSLGALVAVTVAIIYLLLKSAYRARAGIRLIRQARVNPVKKLSMLMEWRSPYTSLQELEALRAQIAKLEATEAVR